MLNDCTLPRASMVMMASGAVSNTERSRASRSSSIAMERPVGRDHEAMAGAVPVHELAVPLAGAQQLRFDLPGRSRELGCEQLVRDPPDRLLGGPAAERPQALAPEQYLAVQRAHDDGREVERMRQLLGARGLGPQPRGEHPTVRIGGPCCAGSRLVPRGLARRLLALRLFRMRRCAASRSSFPGAPPRPTAHRAAVALYGHRLSASKGAAVGLLRIRGTIAFSGVPERTVARY